MSITQRTIEQTAAGGAGLNCYVAVPAEGRGPGLMLLHDAHGLNDHVKHLANVYAEEGWVVLAPDLHARAGADLHLGYSEGERARAQEIADGFDSARGLADAAAALAALKALPECSGDVGVIGHGLGGRIAFLLAAQDAAVTCVVSYYPHRIEAHLAEAAGIACPTLCHLAAGAGGQEAVRERLQANPEIKAYVYAGVDCGFDNANEAAFDRSAHWMAKSRTLELLRRKLGPVYDIATLWEQHLFSEFVDRDVDVSMGTMVDEPYVLVVPTVTGGTGKRDLHRWYSNHFHFQNPEDTRIISISRTVGSDRIVDEFIFCFTHDRVMDWLLPGIAPTGKYIEIPMIAVVNFRGSMLYHEHIWWDQATVLVQAGLIDPAGLPVTGIEQSHAMQDESLPRNRLIAAWG